MLFVSLVMWWNLFMQKAARDVSGEEVARHVCSFHERKSRSISTLRSWETNSAEVDDAKYMRLVEYSLFSGLVPAKGNQASETLSPSGCEYQK